MRSSDGKCLLWEPAIRPECKPAPLCEDLRSTMKRSPLPPIHGQVLDLPPEVRHALRTLARSPGFAITVVLTLALGLAATTTMLGVLDHVLLRPLAYPDSDRLVTLYQSGTSGARRLVSYPTMQDWARDDHQFAGMAWIRGTVSYPVGTRGPESCRRRLCVAAILPTDGHRAGPRARLRYR